MGEQFNNPTLKQYDAWEQYGRYMLELGLMGIGDNWFSELVDKIFRGRKKEKRQRYLEEQMNKMFRVAIGDI